MLLLYVNHLSLLRPSEERHSQGLSSINSHPTPPIFIIFIHNALLYPSSVYWFARFFSPLPSRHVQPFTLLARRRLTLLRTPAGHPYYLTTSLPCTEANESSLSIKDEIDSVFTAANVIFRCTFVKGLTTQRPCRGWAT